jgi:hypothetical protein
MSSKPPKFPKFRKITIADKTLLDNYSKKFEFYSDFVFSNIWSWDLENKLEISILNSNLIFKFTEYDEDYSFLSFLGSNKLAETTHDLISYSENNLNVDFINFIPEEIASKLDSSVFFIEEDRNGFDYIYLPSDIKEYVGTKFKSKRTPMNKFIRDNPTCSVKEINISNKEIQFTTRKIFQTHQRNKTDSQKSSYLNLEAMAFERILNISNHLNILAFGLFLENEMIGFTVDEIIGNKFSLSHFFKINYNANGACEYFNNQIAKELYRLGIEEWNWVEDLGVYNLRKSKESYRPTKLLKQYKISIT